MKIVTCLFSLIIAVAVMDVFLAPASIAEASSRSEFRKKRCKERQNNAGNWQKIHYAFAANKSGDHCAWVWGYTKKKYAIPRALNLCNQKSKPGKCKIIYAK